MRLNRDRAPLALAIIAVMVSAVVTFTHGRVVGDLLAFLPESHDRRTTELARALAHSQLSRAMVIVIAGRTAEESRHAASVLSAQIKSHREVAWLHRGIDRDAERDVYNLFFPRRLELASLQPERELPERLSDSGLRQAARDARSALSGPLSPLLARTLGADPFMVFPELLRRLRQTQNGALTVIDGQFMTEDHRAVIFLATRHSPFDSTHQRPFLAALDRAITTVNQTVHRGVTVKLSGAHRIASRAESSLRADVDRVTLWSSVFVTVLFLLLHRSLRYLFVALVPVAAGLTVASAVTLLVYGSLHGLTLAFGATLIGICFDYPVYFINHHTLEPDPAGPRATLVRVWPGLKLGALTTVGGMLGLAGTGLGGLRATSLFCAVGVATALVYTRVMAPALVPEKPIAVRLQRRWADGLARALGAIEAKPTLGLGFIAFVLVFSLFGLSRLRWTNDARSLTTLDPAALRDDISVREALETSDPGRFIAVTAPDEQTALRHGESLVPLLERAVRNRSITSFSSPHLLLPSIATQRASRSAFTHSPRLTERLETAFVSEGFRPRSFDRFAQALQTPFAPLTFSALEHSPLSAQATAFRLALPSRIAFLTYLRGVTDAHAIARSVATIPGAFYFDQTTYLSEAYRTLRRRTLGVLSLGLAVVFALVFARYRNLRRSLMAFTPAVLAGLGALGLAGALNHPGNLFHVIGFLLVVSMGADYGVFLTETRLHPKALPATVLSLVAACLATVSSFGLLALSRNPALHALGLTTASGMVLSLALSLCARSLQPRPRA